MSLRLFSSIQTLSSLELRLQVSVVADWVKHVTQRAVTPAIILIPFRPLGLWAVSSHLKNKGQDGSP